MVIILSLLPDTQNFHPSITLNHILPPWTVLIFLSISPPDLHSQIYLKTIYYLDLQRNISSYIIPHSIHPIHTFWSDQISNPRFHRICSDRKSWQFGEWKRWGPDVCACAGIKSACRVFDLIFWANLWCSLCDAILWRVLRKLLQMWTCIFAKHTITRDRHWFQWYNPTKPHFLLYIQHPPNLKADTRTAHCTWTVQLL